MQSTPPETVTHNPTIHKTLQVPVFPKRDQIITNVFLKLDFCYGNKTNTKKFTQQHSQTNLVLI